MKKLLQLVVSPTGILFFLILILAGIFRLILMQYVEFKGDEALNLFLATRPIFHHPFPPGSQASSAGILNFPLISYLLFPIVILTTYPPSVSFVIALLNVLTVGGFFLLFAKYHGRLTAFLASVIIALSPWAILYSRKIWAQDFILPLLLPFLLSVYKIIEGKRFFWLIFGISGMLLIQIHQLSGLIPVLFFTTFLISKQKIAWKKLFLGIGLGVIPALPYVWYMAHTFCISCHETTLFARFSYHTAVGLLRPLQIISIGGFHTELNNDFALFAARFPVEYFAGKLTYVTYVLLPIASIFFWIKNKTYKIFTLISFLPVIIYFLLGIQPLMHYYIALLPFFALFVAYLLTQLLQSKKLMFLGVASTLLYFLGLFLFNYGIYSFLSQKGGFAGDYGSGFATSERGIKKALEKFRKDPNYKELTIAQSTPLTLFQGYMPVGKMIFPYNETEKPLLEKQFFSSPNNPIFQRKILAFYTREDDISWDHVVSLKEKSKKHPDLAFIYKIVLENYLEKHLKKVYEAPDFLLLYPQHWQQVKRTNGIMLTDDSIAITITKIQQSQGINEKITTLTCVSNKLWCGISYKPLLVGQNLFQITVQLHDVEEKNNVKLKKYSLMVTDEIIHSIRPN